MEISLKEIEEILFKIFENPQKYHLNIEESTATALIKTEGDENGLSMTPDNVQLGYPLTPFSRRIACHFFNLINKGYCEASEFQKFDLLDEAEYVETRKSNFLSIRPQAMGMPSLWSDWSSEEKLYRMASILNDLQLRGLLDLLGLRKTFGSHEVIPPTKTVLLKTFQAKHHTKSDLTVGARALAKHCHRDETSKWWGQCTGSEFIEGILSGPAAEANKNDHAFRKVNEILNNAEWINIHELPGQTAILEIRHSDGYGARWSPDGLTFRGFLEPMMEEGWTVGYRH